jgi:hypothetical protein
MKTITVCKDQLIETIENVTSDFGNSFIVIAVDNDGLSYSGTVIDSDDHIIMTLSGLANYIDENQNDPGTDEYCSLDVATYIVEQEDFIKTSFEYDEDEHVVIKIVGFNDIAISSTAIIDNCNEDEEGNFQPSQISVNVNFEVAEKKYSLEFQTTTTHDFGAYSNKLAAYDVDESYDLIVEAFGEAGAMRVIDVVMEKSNAKTIRDDYVSNHYQVQDEAFNGIDANSQINKAIQK